MQLKTCDTPYAGVIFRSRLEARWASFLDCLDLRWQYEPEAFEIDGKPFVPTFRVATPQGSYRWLVVRHGPQPDDIAVENFQAAACKANSHPVVIVFGSPDDLLHANQDFCPRCGMPTRFDKHLFHCEPCDAETPSGRGNPLEVTGVRGFSWTACTGSIHLDELLSELWFSLTRKAARQAQAKRFEISGGEG